MRTLNRLLLLSLLAVTPVVTMAADDAPSADPDVTIRTEGDKPSRNTGKMASCMQSR